MSLRLTPLESAVLHAVLEGTDPTRTTLRAQLGRLVVKSREHTGVGFFTELAVAGDVEPAPVAGGRLVLGDVQATLEGLTAGAGFVLYVENGFVHTLEGYTYDEPWPDVVEHFSLIGGGG